MWYQLPTKGAAADYDNISSELADLVRICNVAHRNNRGDLVWLCWQPAGAGAKPARVHSINSGAMLIACTPRGAGVLLRLFEGDLGHFPPNHFDVELKNWLTQGDNAELMKACYVTPPVGNYCTHQSGCDPTYSSGQGRPSCWGERWVCRGTRESQDPQGRHKWLASWTRKGNPVWIGRAGVDDGTKNWTSFWRGAAKRPKFVPADERRPQKKKPAAAGAAIADGSDIEPTAMSGPLSLRPPPPPAAASTRPPSRGRGAGRATPHPWPHSAAPSDDPVEDADQTGQQTRAAKRTKHESRFVRHCLVYRSFRTWTDNEAEVAFTYKSKRQLQELSAGLLMKRCFLGLKKRVG